MSRYNDPSWTPERANQQLESRRATAARMRETVRDAWLQHERMNAREPRNIGNLGSAVRQYGRQQILDDYRLEYLNRPLPGIPAEDLRRSVPGTWARTAESAPPLDTWTAAAGGEYRVTATWHPDGIRYSQIPTGSNAIRRNQIPHPTPGPGATTAVYEAYRATLERMNRAFQDTGNLFVQLHPSVESAADAFRKIAETACECGDPGDKHWEHTEDGCSFIEHPVRTNHMD